MFAHISEDAELLWRLARASRDLAQLRGAAGEERKALVYEALECAKRALERTPASFAAHKVRLLSDSPCILRALLGWSAVPKYTGENFLCLKVEREVLGSSFLSFLNTLPS